MSQNAQLSRSINFPLLTLYGVGTILGTGIYVLIGRVAENSGLYIRTYLVLISCSDC